jgi:hypothetical protein
MGVSNRLHRTPRSRLGCKPGVTGGYQAQRGPVGPEIIETVETLSNKTLESTPGLHLGRALRFRFSFHRGRRGSAGRYLLSA